MSLIIAPTDDIAACRALRMEVFVQEQNVPADLEIDDLDDTSTHILAVQDGRPVGTARLRVYDGYGKVGRVCVARDQRGTRLGAKVMVASIDWLRDQDGVREVRLSAQVPVIGFYETLGFVAHGPEYDDAGIPHRDMVLTL